MGCSICLDAYGDDDDVRPVCLPCGHVFHGNCITQWLQDGPGSSSHARRGCPKCKAKAKKDDITRLWPDDVHDLDRLLAERNDPDSQWAASLAHLTPDEAKQLLDDLVDFQCAAQQYVQGVLGVNAVSTRAAGKRVFKLIQDKTNNPAVHQNLQTMLTKLESSILTFDYQLSRASKESAVLSKGKEQVDQKLAHVRKRRDEVQALEKAVQAKEAAVAKSTQTLQEARAAFHKQTAGWEAHVNAARKEVEKSKMEAQQAAADAARARVEAKQWVAARQVEFEELQSKIDERIAAAEARRDDAERERDAHRTKENEMAAQMKVMQEKMEKWKGFVASEKQKRADERKRFEGERAKLEKQLKQAKAAAAVAAPTLMGSSSINNNTVAPSPSSTAHRRGSAASLSPTSMPSPFIKRSRAVAGSPTHEHHSANAHAFDNDEETSPRLVFLDSTQRSNRESAPAAPDAQSSSKPRNPSGRYRHRNSSSEEEDDDFDAPMPGLRFAHAHRQHKVEPEGGSPRRSRRSEKSVSSNVPFGRVGGATAPTSASAALAASASASQVHCTKIAPLTANLATAGVAVSPQPSSASAARPNSRGPYCKCHDCRAERHRDDEQQLQHRQEEAKRAQTLPLAQLLGGKGAAVVTGPKHRLRA
ncbi:hypothetical protein BDZ90DRAFT_280236 [Jaminaea rosea]|uniref:RING-type domain-containing protein n=1 Tax=Jaminaea rosea TaxID=1569628 RepID=A0A316UUG4_9BASI|nr:hypothetical protein BDZ90DRAFT_280236 [Jaminaea rosea]PWN26745.1 hypothetical protein BDZ90DRAFT_280236 [Jaminaea rosea]